MSDLQTPSRQSTSPLSWFPVISGTPRLCSRQLLVSLPNPVLFCARFFRFQQPVLQISSTIRFQRVGLGGRRSSESSLATTKEHIALLLLAMCVPQLVLKVRFQKLHRLSKDGVVLQCHREPRLRLYHRATRPASRTLWFETGCGSVQLPCTRKCQRLTHWAFNQDFSMIPQWQNSSARQQ